MTPLTPNIFDELNRSFYQSLTEKRLLCTTVIEDENAYQLDDRIYFGPRGKARLLVELRPQNVGPGQTWIGSLRAPDIEDADQLAFAQKGRQFNEDELITRLQIASLLERIHGSKSIEIFQTFWKRFPDAEMDLKLIAGGKSGESGLGEEKSVV